MRFLPCLIIIGILPSLAQSQPVPIETSEGDETILLLLGNAIELPWVFDQPPTIMLPIAFSLGLGYRFNPQLDLYGAYNINLLTKVLPDKTKFFVQGSYTEWGVESRYFIIGTTYVLGGIHATTMRTYNIEQYSDSAQTYEYRYPPIRKVIPSISAGLGHAGSLGFIELRIHIGLTQFDVVESLKGSLFTYSLRYGFNIPFHIR